MSSLTVRAAGASSFDDAARPDDETGSMQALIGRARSGDAAAQSAVLESMQHTWFRFCLSVLGDADIAADAVQETALRWLQRIGRFRGDSALQTWSLGIALNVCREIRRRRRPVGIDEVADPTAEQGGPDAAASDRENRDRLHALLGELPMRQREVLVLRYFEGLSIRQTADVMNCATGTVKATIWQALRKMRRSWKDQR